MDSVVKVPGDDTDDSQFEELRDHCRSICGHLSRVVVDRDNYIQRLDDLAEAKKALELKIVCHTSHNHGHFYLR